jgi:tetratricopeptide (TPR) repeat protein
MVTGRIHLEPVQKKPDQENVSAYALAFIYSPDARTTTLCVASQYMWGAGKPEREAQLRVWFNEESVFGWGKPKYVNLTGFDRIPVQLKPGRNTVLVRVSSPKRLGFRLRLSDGPGEKALLAASLIDWPLAADSLRRIPQNKLVRLGSHWSLYCSCLAATNASDYAEAVKATINYYAYATGEKSLGMFLEATTQQASLAMDKEKLAQTIETLKAPKPKWVQRQVGRALFRAERYQEAIDWHRAHSLTGIEPECTVAMAHYRLGQQKEADKLLREAKDREFSQLSELKLPQWFTGYVLIREANQLITGESLDDDPEWRATREKLERAVAAFNPETLDYDLALLLQPREPRLWVLRGERNADLMQWADAERDFDNALAVDRKNLHAWLCLARYWFRRDNLEKSRKAYSKLLNLDHAGTLRPESLNDLEQNDRLFVALLDLRKRDIPLWRARGTSLCRQGRWKDAVLVWKRLLELMPNDWQLHRDLALLHAGAGDQPGYAHACEGMMAGSEDVVPPLTAWYTSIMPGSGIEPDAVVAMAQTYSDANAADIAARSTIGAALLRAGRCEEALGELEFAARLSESDEDPNGTPAAYLWFLMAIAHGKTGNHAESRQWHDKAQQWVEQHAESHQLSSWTRQLTIKILAAEARQLLGQVANVTD